MEKVSSEHRQKMIQRADLLKAIGNPLRLCIIEKLIHEGPTSVSDITSCMDASQPAVSQHLRKLKDMGIVESQKEENRIYYSCTREDIKKLIACLDLEV
nr:metalloregulator ArsR/SmtB family transcription factor [Tissierellia bacterium]